MKLLKITTIAVFLVTLILSNFGVNAAAYHYFVSTTIPAHSAWYTSDSVSKDRESNQYFYNMSAYDKVTGVKRAIKVYLVNEDTSSTSATKEINTDTRVTYTDSGIRIEGNYHSQIKTSNPLSNAISLNGTWYLDDTAL